MTLRRTNELLTAGYANNSQSILASHAWQRCTFHPITRTTLKWNSISLIFKVIHELVSIYEIDIYRLLSVCRR